MPEIGLHTCYDGTGRTPLAHILRLGDVKLLLDAGWTRECRPEDLEPIRAALPTIDAGAQGGGLRVPCSIWMR